MTAKAIKFLVAITFLAGCASSSNQKSLDSRREPKIIAIRNISTQEAQSITIQEDRDDDQAARVGGVSPAVTQFTYLYTRRPTAPPFPKRVRVKWQYARTPERSVTKDLKDILRQSTGEPNEALVFELNADQTVTVRLDRVQP